MRKYKLLNGFGKQYVQFVHDRVLHQSIDILKNKAKSPDDKVLSKKLKEFSPYQINVCKELIIEAIDSCLHYTLFMFEEYEDEMEIIIKDKAGVYSLASISDGLSGELYGEDGWIAKYSEYFDCKEKPLDLFIETTRSELWTYVDKNYNKFLQERNIYQVFCEGDEEVLRKIIQLFKEEIFMNYCPNCGNLKKTPRASQCLKCMEFHDPDSGAMK